MLFAGGLLGLLVLGFWIFCLVDVLTTGESDCRNLPKIGWVVLVVLLSWVGGLAWLLAGRPANRRGIRSAQWERPAPSYPEYDRPGRLAAPDPESDEEFLRRCRERAEEQRRKARGEDDPSDT